MDLTDFCKLKGEFLPGLARGRSCQALNPKAVVDDVVQVAEGAAAN